METKKNREKSAENLRMPIIFSGLLFVGGMVLASFTYGTPLDEKTEAPIATNANEVVYVQEEAPEEIIENDAPKPIAVAPPEPFYTPIPPSPEPPQPNPPIPIPMPDPPKPGPMPEPDIFEFTDKEATFPGGTTEMMRWMGENIVYPEISIQIEEQGKVYVSFVVEANGDITNVQVERGISQALDREAKRVIRSMPQWEAGEMGGKKVRSRCRLPIIFTLE